MYAVSPRDISSVRCFLIVQDVCLMQSNLKIAFNDLEHGWVRLTISSGVETFTVVASYTPSDSFLDLTNALHSLLRDGQAKVMWNCEPPEYEMLFSSGGSDISLQIYEYSDYRRGNERGEQVFAVSGTYKDICIPFWRALRDLQGRFSAEELDSRWHRPFPSREIDLLTAEIKEVREK